MSLSHRSYKVSEYKPSDMLPYIKTIGGEKPVELRSLDIRIVVTGLYAETTQTMIFHNPNHRDLEGDLRFPMPDNATVCGYALDLNGQLIDGIIVPKEKARRILEAEIRKGVDPGLVEQIQGNVYRARVYPVPAEGTRTVRITYVSDLAVNDNNASYHLPLGYINELDKVSLKIEVIQCSIQPELSGPGNLTLNKWSDRWVAEATLDTAAIVEDLLIRLPQLPEQIINVEQNDDDVFFSISALVNDLSKERWKPERIGIAWDASGSRCSNCNNRGGLKKEFELIDALFEDWQPERIELMVFRNTVEKTINSFDSFEALKNYLETIVYDGATDLSAIDFEGFSEDVEACLLFSDGLNSCGLGLPQKSRIPVVTVNSSAHCNSSFLEHVAFQANGMYINLLRTTIEDVVSSLCKLSDRVEIAQTEGCEDVFFSTKNGRFAILGRLKKTVGTIRLSGPGGFSRTIEISSSLTSRSNNISRAWAGLKVGELVLLDEKDSVVVALGRRFGVVTPGTSLLVLETVEQYLEYNIEPPKSSPRLHQEFTRQQERERIKEGEQLKKQMDQVITWWEQRVEWWNRDFKADYLQRLTEQEEKLSQVARSSRAVMEEPDHSRDESNESLEDCCFLRSPENSDDSDLCDFAPAEECSSYDDASSAEIPLADIDFSRKGNFADASINIKPWSPDVPYLHEMRRVSAQEIYSVYLAQRKTYANSPSFFLDCGDFFFKQGQAELALRVLSNLEELQLNDIALMRMYAWRLQQAGQLNMAVKVFERILGMRDDEPQSYRDLALALVDRWQENKIVDDAIRAMHLFYKVVNRSWDRFPEIETVVLVELNHLIFRAGLEGIKVPEMIDNRLIRHLDLDIRISMSWDADLTDVDLHVFDPDGGHAYYGHNLTLIGGLVSKDFTDGYGPEEYLLRNAKPGTYIVKAHYFGSHQQTICGPCTITATVFTNYGRKNEQKQLLTLRLDESSDQEMVGEIHIEGQPWVKSELPAAKSRNLLSGFKSLTKGMNVNEVKDAVGLPDDIEGDGMSILIYYVEENTTVKVAFSPKLDSVLCCTGDASICFV